jgi:hypothetical protein
VYQLPFKEFKSVVLATNGVIEAGLPPNLSSLGAEIVGSFLGSS